MSSQRHEQEIRRRRTGAGRRRLLRVGVLSAHRAPGLSYLLEEDANRGRLYDIACVVTSEESIAEAATAASHRIPVLVHPIRQFCRAHGWRLSDPRGRAAYDGQTVERLAPYDLDLIVLAGYLYVLTEPMLKFFSHRIINVHHSDLTVRNACGRVRLTGLQAVRDAILAGESETRATVHVVTSDLDQGPPFLRSWPFPVAPLVRSAVAWRADDVLRAYVYAHQEWMIRATWGPLIATAIELVATERVDLSELAQAAASLAVAEIWDLEEGGAIRGYGPQPRGHAPSAMAVTGS
jgi:folate-dependent phosphoribosylglycinamide formyltransferase PurN